jgi:uncharacterized membrane protein (Fun14 family)
VCLVIGFEMGYLINQIISEDMILGLIVPILILVVIGLQFEIIKVNREIKDMAVKNDEKTES